MTWTTAETREVAAEIRKVAAAIGSDPMTVLNELIAEYEAEMAEKRTTGWRAQCDHVRAFLNRPTIRATWGTLLIFAAGLVSYALTDAGVIA